MELALPPSTEAGRALLRYSQGRRPFLPLFVRPLKFRFLRPFPFPRRSRGRPRNSGRIP